MDITQAFVKVEAHMPLIGMQSSLYIKCGPAWRSFLVYANGRVPSPISVGPACRAGLRGHAATSDESRSNGQPRGDVERICVPGRFALRRKSFPAERTYFYNHPRLHPDQRQMKCAVIPEYASGSVTSGPSIAAVIGRVPAEPG